MASLSCAVFLFLHFINIFIDQVIIYFNLSSQACRMNQKDARLGGCSVGSEAGGAAALAALQTLHTTYLA